MFLLILMMATGFRFESGYLCRFLRLHRWPEIFDFTHGCTHCGTQS